MKSACNAIIANLGAIFLLHCRKEYQVIDRIQSNFISMLLIIDVRTHLKVMVSRNGAMTAILLPFSWFFAVLLKILRKLEVWRKLTWRCAVIKNFIRLTCAVAAEKNHTKSPNWPIKFLFNICNKNNFSGFLICYALVKNTTKFCPPFLCFETIIHKWLDV